MIGLESAAFTDQDETNQMGYASGHLPWRLPKLIPSDGRFACYLVLEENHPTKNFELQKSV